VFNVVRTAALRPLLVAVTLNSSLSTTRVTLFAAWSPRGLCAQVVNEFDNCLSTIRAVCGLHTHGKTAFEWKQEDDELRYKLKSVGTARLALFLFAQACRLTIACALCYGGSYFIAHTIGLGDLILNCVALEVRF
jgi:hypothetical protein